MAIVIQVCRKRVDVMSNVVWASNAMINPAMLRPFSNCFDDGSEKGRDLYTKGYRGNNAGESLSADYFPPEIFVSKDADRDYEKLAELFFAGSYWVVSGEVADVMRQFDMGQGHLYPTEVFRKDRKTPIGDKWFCLNFGNVKQALLPDQSLGLRPLGPSKTFWMLSDLSDNSIALNNTALNGPDIWVDAIFGNVFFVSSRLSNALKMAGVSRAFGLKKCRVI